MQDFPPLLLLLVCANKNSLRFALHAVSTGDCSSAPLSTDSSTRARLCYCPDCFVSKKSLFVGGTSTLRPPASTWHGSKAFAWFHSLVGAQTVAKICAAHGDCFHFGWNLTHLDWLIYCRIQASSYSEVQSNHFTINVHVFTLISKTLQLPLHNPSVPPSPFLMLLPSNVSSRRPFYLWLF